MPDEETLKNLSTRIEDIRKRAQETTADSLTREPFDQWRETVQISVEGIRNLMTHPGLGKLTPAEAGECKANIMIAVRHMEDARMRLGKAIQAIDGGISIYDPKHPINQTGKQVPECRTPTPTPEAA